MVSQPQWHRIVRDGEPVSQIEVSHLINMGVACLGAFFFVVSAGSVFIIVRIRKQNNDESPTPQPPPMTIDAHATDGKSAFPSIEGSAQKPAQQHRQPMQTKASPIQSEYTEEGSPPPTPRPTPRPVRKPFTPIDEEDGELTEKNAQKPRPAGYRTQPEDETERVSISGPGAAPTFISALELEDVEAETATVIIDRSRPVDEDK